MSNQLYPVFFKIDQLQTLIIGGGNVGLEKLYFILKNSPQAKITLIATDIKADIYELLNGKKYQVTIIQKSFESTDLDGKQLVIAATNDRALNLEIQQLAKQKNILINVADTPELCDFYLGSIVTKGDLKIAISTNGKSPTFAKRFRQVLEEILPEEIDELLNNLHQIRQRLQGNFAQKVKHLNQLTTDLVS